MSQAPDQRLTTGNDNGRPEAPAVSSPPDRRGYGHWKLISALQVAFWQLTSPVFGSRLRMLM